MKNKKILFGTIVLLFAITGICNIPCVSAAETIEIPPLSYVYYGMGYLEYRDEILINEIDSDGAINVYIMNEEQLNTLLDSGGLIWTYIIRWEDIVWLYDWTIDITEDGYYYVVIYNKDLIFGKTVYVDIGVHYYTPVKPDNFFLGRLVFIVIPAIIIIAGIVITVVLVKRHKRKVPKEDIIPEAQEKENS